MLAALWSSDTFVDFDNGLNMAVKRLREALGDDADRPILIETIPRRGYRFLAPVESRRDSDEAIELDPDPVPGRDGLTGSKRWALFSLLVGLLVFTGIFVSAKRESPPAIPRVVDSASITKDGLPKTRATLRVVSDGSRLYFEEGSLGDTEQNTAVVQVSTREAKQPVSQFRYEIPSLTTSLKLVPNFSWVQGSSNCPAMSGHSESCRCR